MEPDVAGARLVAQLLGYACCCGALLVVIAGLVWLFLRKPAAAAGWPAQALPELGIRLQVPPGAKVQALGGQVRVELPSGYAYHLKRGDAAKAIAERKAWLQSAPTRWMQVLLHEPDAFIYAAREGDLADVSAVAGKAGWLLETHGSIVEHGDLLAKVQARLSPQDQAAMAQAQEELKALATRGEPMTSPAMRAVMDRIGALTRAAREIEPTKVTAMTPDECRQAVALVRSITPL